jgi:hypothetical protein
MATDFGQVKTIDGIKKFCDTRIRVGSFTYYVVGFRGGGGRVSDKLLQNTTGVGGSPGILYEVEKNFQKFSN